jgi:hypothetical protein
MRPSGGEAALGRCVRRCVLGVRQQRRHWPEVGVAVDAVGGAVESCGEAEQQRGPGGGRRAATARGAGRRRRATRRHRAQTRRKHAVGRRGNVLAAQAGRARLLTRKTRAMKLGDTTQDVLTQRCIPRVASASAHWMRKGQVSISICGCVRSPLPAPALQQRARAQKEAEDGGAADRGAPDVAHFEQPGHLSPSAPSAHNHLAATE